MFLCISIFISFILKRKLKKKKTLQLTLQFKKKFCLTHENNNKQFDWKGKKKKQKRRQLKWKSNSNDVSVFCVVLKSNCLPNERDYLESVLFFFKFLCVLFWFHWTLVMFRLGQNCIPQGPLKRCLLLFKKKKNLFGGVRFTLKFEFEKNLHQIHLINTVLLNTENNHNEYGK